MITGLDLNETIDYKVDSDKDNPTIWKLGVLSSYLYSRITAESEPLEGSFKVLQIAIKGWDNFALNGGLFPYKTEKQKVIGREMEVVPLSDLERIPMKVLTELYNQILIINNLKEDERKN